MALSTLKIKADSSQAVKEVGKLSSTFEGLSSSTLKTVAGVGAVGASLYAIGKGMVNAHDKAVKLNYSFRLMGGMGRSVFNILKIETAGLVDDLALAQQSAKLMSLNTGLSLRDMGDVYKWAIGRGRAFGRSASESIEDITRGFTTFSAQILDNLGIVLPKGLSTAQAKVKYIMSQIRMDLKLNPEIFSMDADLIAEKQAKIGQSLQNVVSQFSLAKKGVTLYGAGLDWLAKKLKKSSEDIKSDFLADATTSTNRLYKKIKEINEKLAEALADPEKGAYIEEYRNQLTLLRKNYDNLAPSMKKVAEYLNIDIPADVINKLKAVDNATKGIITTTEELNTIYLNAGLKHITDNTKALQKALESTSEEYNKLYRDLDANRKKIRQAQGDLMVITGTSKEAERERVETQKRLAVLTQESNVLQKRFKLLEKQRSGILGVKNANDAFVKTLSLSLLQMGKFSKAEAKQKDNFVAVARSTGIQNDALLQFNKVQSDAMLRTKSLILLLEKKGRTAEATALKIKLSNIKEAKSFADLGKAIISAFSFGSTKNTKTKTSGGVSPYIQELRTLNKEIHKLRIQSRIDDEQYTEALNESILKKAKLRKLGLRRYKDWLVEYNATKDKEKRIEDESLLLQDRQVSIWKESLKRMEEAHRKSLLKSKELNAQKRADFENNLRMVNNIKMQEAEDLARWDAFILAEKKKNLAKLQAVQTKFNNDMKSSALGASQVAVKAMWIENAELKKLGKTREEYFKEQLKGWLNAKSIEWSMKSIEYGAMAIADMWFNPAKASTDATVSGIYAGLALTAGVAGHSIAGGGSSNTDMGSSNPEQSSIAGTKEATGRNIVINITDSVVGNNPDDVASSIVKMINNADERGVLNV